MSSFISRALKRALLPDDRWSLDVDLRYLPVVRFLRKHAPQSTVLEVGSGLIGIPPYLGREAVGTDASFPGEVRPGLIPVVARGLLPFKDRSFDAVVSLDTLEHIPRESRQTLFDEAFRTARKFLIVGFPEGEAAENHDRKMEAYYIRQHGDSHPYFVEHREYVVPRGTDVSGYLREAQQATGRSYTVTRISNVNIAMRSVFMRLIWHPNRIIRGLYFLLTMFSRWDWVFHFGRCYRAIYFITLDSDSHA